MKIGWVILAIFWWTATLVFAGGERLSPSVQRWVENPSQQSIKVWILLTDKGPDVASRLREVQQQLTPAARLRRQLHRPLNHLVDESDLPVYAEYLRKIENNVQRVVVQSRWLNAVSAYVTADQIQTLLSFPFVQRIQPVRRFRIADPVAAVPVSKAVMAKSSANRTTEIEYGPSYNQLNQINVIPLHELGYTGEGITIAMLDAGFQNLEHETFAHMDIADTWDFPNNDSNVENQSGQLGEGTHGTYTLSTIGGFTEGMLVGPAFNATFLLYKTEVTDWERHVEEDYWVAAAERAEQQGAWIISSSLGYSTFDSGEGDYTWEDMDGNTTIVTRGADRAAQKGLLVITSAGNEGSTPVPQNTLVAPSDGDSVIAAAAVDEFGYRASFSSVGPSADGRVKPDLAARGVGTYCASPATNRSYTQVSGTSLSCPLVAGAAAIVWQVNPRLSNMQVREALRRTASQADQPDRYLGWGIVNAYEAAFYFTPRIVHQPLPDTVGLRQNYTLEAVVTSRFPLQKDSVVVIFRFGNQQWQRQSMQAVNDTLFQATIEGPGVPTTLDYYISAVGDSGKGYVPSFAPQKYFTTYLSSDPSAIQDPDEPIARQFYLWPAFPNPFNGTTHVKVTVRQKGEFALTVYNVQGQRIEQLFSGEMAPGDHEFIWNPSRVSSGVFYIVLYGENETMIRKLLHLK